MITVGMIKALLVDLDFPPAKRIDPLPVYAGYHSLWVLTYPRDQLLQIRQTRLALLPEKPRDLSQIDIVDTELILRIADNKIPKVKNLNEVAVLRWVASNTGVAAPEIMAHDSTSDNALSREFILETRLRGTSTASLYPNLNGQQVDYILEQLASFMIQLYNKPHNHLGALKKHLPTKAILPGPPLNEKHYWQVHHIERFWKDYWEEDYQSLNPSAQDGYPSVTSWLSDHINKSIYRINLHNNLAPMRRYISKLQALLTWINTPVVASRLNDVEPRLMHNDLSFGQVLVDPKTLHVSGILDWEFAVVLPWPVARGFMLKTPVEGRPNWQAEKASLLKRFDDIAMTIQGGPQMLEGMKWKYQEQRKVFEVVDLLMEAERYSVENKVKAKEKSADVMGRVLDLLNDLGVRG